MAITIEGSDIGATSYEVQTLAVGNQQGIIEGGSYKHRMQVVGWQRKYVITCHEKGSVAWGSSILATLEGYCKAGTQVTLAISDGDMYTVSSAECIITAVRPRFIDTGASKRKIFTIELVEQQ